MSLPLGSSRRGRLAFALLSAARRPLLFLDLDGTLAPFSDRPEDARVPLRTRKIIRAMRATGARVVLVSGRSVAQVRLVAPVAVDAILGDHGGRYSTSGEAHSLLRASGSTFAHAIDRVTERLSGRSGLRLEVKERSLAVHLRVGHGREHHEALSVAAILRAEGFRALLGHHVIDGQLPGVDKGHGVLRWLERERGRDALLYAGDDTTDEDAFVALRHRAVTIAVGPRPRGAALRTRDPGTFAAWLARLARARSGAGHRRGGPAA